MCFSSVVAPCLSQRTTVAPLLGCLTAGQGATEFGDRVVAFVAARVLTVVTVVAFASTALAAFEELAGELEIGVTLVRDEGWNDMGE